MKSRMKLDKVIVVDLESTCWEPRPKYQALEYTSEIIEVGICMLDLNLPWDQAVSQKQSIMVKPRHSKVSEFCTKLTTITQADVDKGIDLSEASKKIHQEYDSKNHVWISFGDYDRKQFDKDCRSKNIEYPFGPRHINAKNIFALLYRLEQEIELVGALNILGLSLDGTHHRGLDDALNISKIVHNILQKREITTPTS